MKVAVIFGGMSTEHDVSIVSGISIIKNLNQNKYEIYPIYIDENGDWYKYTKKIEEIGTVEVGDKLKEIEKIENPMNYLKQMDCIFPVLHGLYGEDGTVQGLFELLKIPYVGCKVLASSICMDKVYAKIIFEKAGLNQAKYVYIRKDKEKYRYIANNFEETICTLEEVEKEVEEKLEYPMFVKPSNSGSSVGIRKVKNKKELEEAIKYAGKYDNKILVEQGIIGREIECAVLGNEEVLASCVGEVLSAEEFYSFDSKYKNSQSRTVIPANIEENISEEIRKQAIKAYKAAGGAGLSRVDFFVENGTNKIIINEINTMPGFTAISMYPKLFEAVGIKYTELLDKIIELSQK
jgi:D-ala D-ala ligase N-terminal domain protein